MKTDVVVAILVVLGLLAHVQAYRERPPTAICGTDFPIFYASARLVGTPNLYSPEAVQRGQQQAIGCTSAAAAFIRLPYFAALVWPLTLLPVGAAFALWRTAALAADLGFVASFGPQWKWALLACVWSTPLTWDLDNGQDIAFILLFVAAGAALVQRGRPFAAGLCFALCAAKFHLLALIPLLLVGQRLWRAAAGLAVGGVAVIAACFAAGGLDWPVRFFKAVSNPRIDPAPQALHNLRGLVHGSVPLEIILGLTVVAAVWITCRRAGFPMALASALAGSLLISHHLTYSDWAMVLPVGLTVGRISPNVSIRVLAVALITPLIHYIDGTRIPEAALLALVYALAWQATRHRPVAQA